MVFEATMAEAEEARADGDLDGALSYYNRILGQDSSYEAALWGRAKVFLEAGYENASMDAVAAAAEVSKQTVYRHFGSKDALGIEIVMPDPARGNEIEQLDATDLDHPVAGFGIEAGGFGIENDFAHLSDGRSL